MVTMCIISHEDGIYQHIRLYALVFLFFVFVNFGYI
jgi:hypothetical protein